MQRAATFRSGPMLALLAALAPFAGLAEASAPAFDVVIEGGLVVDGTGAEGRIADVAIKGDRIAAIGSLKHARAARRLDAAGMVVAPGFINMLSQATSDLLGDGRSQSDIRQGVTLELLGEGLTPGPVNATMKAQSQARLKRLGIEGAEWASQAEYMRVLAARGVSPNIASFVGATNLRMMVVGNEDRRATPAEIAAMQAEVRKAMAEGAFGVTSALGYAPAAYADRAELAALARAAAPWDGMYISHLRDEGDGLAEAVDELIAIAREAGVKAEIYHFKAMGMHNLPTLERSIAAIEAARREGLHITADMYPYNAAATGLDVTMPLWVQTGGQEAWIARLRDPAVRAKVADEMRHPPPGTSSRLLAAGSPDNVRILGARSPALQPIVGKTLSEIARARGIPPEETVIDLVVEDNSRLQVAYFMIPEAGVDRVMRLPWVSIGSDGGSMSVDETATVVAHPREYGTFARLLGHYVREEKRLALPEAVRRLSGLPAANLGLADRGLLKAGYFADVVVFDPRTIADRATYDQPNRYAIGVRDVLVNGVAVLAGGEHTGARPGRFIRNPKSAAN